MPIDDFSGLAVSDLDRSLLTRLEENMWREETRFDKQFMEASFAFDFFEYGRSGRKYTRADSLNVSAHAIDAVLPLPNFEIRLLDIDTAQVTYNSAVTYEGVVEHARRSSIWSRTVAGWVMRFHQGTRFET